MASNIDIENLRMTAAQLSMALSLAAADFVKVYTRLGNDEASDNDRHEALNDAASSLGQIEDALPLFTQLLATLMTHRDELGIGSCEDCERADAEFAQRQNARNN